MLDADVILCDKHQETSFGYNDVTARLTKENNDDGPLVFTPIAAKIKADSGTGIVNGNATWEDDNSRGTPDHLKYGFKFKYIGTTPTGTWMITFIHSRTVRGQIFS
jgi:hypothetical protein